MVHSTRQGEMYTEAGFNRCCLRVYSEKKLPFLQVDNLNRRRSRVFLFSLLLVSPLLERVCILKYSSPFFPSYFSTNFLSGEQFLEPFCLSLSVFTALSHLLSTVWTVLFAPLDFSFLLLSGSVLQVEFLLSFFFIYLPPPSKNKRGLHLFIVQHQ